MASAGDEWKCSSCTYMNQGFRTQCELCYTVRPGGASTGASSGASGGGASTGTSGGEPEEKRDTVRPFSVVQSSSVGVDHGDIYLDVYPEWIRGAGRAGCCCPFWCCCFILVILIVSLVPAAFSACEYPTWCLKKNTLKNEVDISAVYDNGNRGWGIEFSSLALPRTYQRQELKLFIFSQSGLEYRIDIVFFWRIDKARLASLFRRFGLAYAGQVKSRANAKIKNAAPTFTIQQYILERPRITKALHLELQAELSVIGIDVPPHLFFLTDIFLPAEIKKKNLDAAIQAQRNIEQQHRQEAERVRQGTEGIRRAIQANSSLIRAESEATVFRVVTQAAANANKTLSAADGRGLDLLFTQINATQAIVKEMYVRYFALLETLQGQR